MGKDTLNIKQAVCCSEVTPEKENREGKENADFRAGVQNSVFYWDSIMLIGGCGSLL